MPVHLSVCACESLINTLTMMLVGCGGCSPCQQKLSRVRRWKFMYCLVHLSRLSNLITMKTHQHDPNTNGLHVSLLNPIHDLNTFHRHDHQHRSASSSTDNSNTSRTIIYSPVFSLLTFIIFLSAISDQDRLIYWHAIISFTMWRCICHVIDAVVIIYGESCRLGHYAC